MLIDCDSLPYESLMIEYELSSLQVIIKNHEGRNKLVF